MTRLGTSAPGRLELIRRFVNTRDIEQDLDALTAADELTAWLHAVELLPERDDARPADVRLVQEFRETLRDAMEANHRHEPMRDKTVSALNQAAASARLTTTFTEDSHWKVRPATKGVPGAVGALLSVVIESMTDGTWSRLKVCSNDECRWAFYDNSRARSGKWCSMENCGNRSKQRAWRQRHQ